MIPNISKDLDWLEMHPNILQGISRGIERETLRIDSHGYLATTLHPISLGSPLKHKWITTDFAEALLEFVTPNKNDIHQTLIFLRDIHRYVTKQLKQERMWPFSMPCIIDNPDKVQLAQYGTSNLGKMKTLYRQGLRNRYGSLMQLISGVHYNFSLPISFWNYWLNKVNTKKNSISDGYLCLIRNYYRFGWLIPYLFGASPAIHTSFLKNSTELNFQTDNKGMLWLPYATSLRLSDLGYTNNGKTKFNIKFNSLEEYIRILKHALITPSKKYIQIGEKDSQGNLLQLNLNILQNENELYLPIRPKRLIKNDQPMIQELLNHGIEYIEIRSLDINPFSAIGINEDQVRFLDLFLIWCTLVNESKISEEEIEHNSKNWNKIILDGRNPNLLINIYGDKNYYPLLEIGKKIFFDLRRIAQILDLSNKSNKYQNVCDKLINFFYYPELTYSARIFNKIKHQGLILTGLQLAEKYHRKLMMEPLEMVSKNDFINQRIESIKLQKKLEINDNLDFQSYLSILENKFKKISIHKLD